MASIRFQFLIIFVLLLKSHAFASNCAHALHKVVVSDVEAGRVAFELSLPIQPTSLASSFPKQSVQIKKSISLLKDFVDLNRIETLKGKSFSKILYDIMVMRQTTAEKLEVITATLPESQMPAKEYLSGLIKRTRAGRDRVRDIIAEKRSLHEVFEATDKQMGYLSFIDSSIRGIEGEIEVMLRVPRLRGTGALEKFVVGGVKTIERKLIENGEPFASAEKLSRQIGFREIDIVYDRAVGKKAFLEVKSYSNVMSEKSWFFTKILKQADDIKALQDQAILSKTARRQIVFVNGITSGAAEQLRHRGVEVFGVIP